jgi:hypothetical protein
LHDDLIAGGGVGDIIMGKSRAEIRRRRAAGELD